MAASIVHIPLSPMTLEINSVSSEYVTWVVCLANLLIPEVDKVNSFA